MCIRAWFCLVIIATLCASAFVSAMDSGFAYHTLSNTAYDKQGRPALFTACAEGCTALVRTLLEAGAPVNQRTVIGNTPLYAAVQHDANLNIVDLLLAYGADLELKNSHGFTPLHCACIAGASKVVERLVAAGADVNAVTKRGDTPLSLAMPHGEGLMVCLLDAGAQASLSNDKLLFYAVEKGCIRLLQHTDKKEINARNEKGQTPLLVAACKWDRQEIVKLLIAWGSDLDAVDTHGNTALHGACDASIVQLLLEAGAAVDAKNKEGLTPLMAAIKADVKLGFVYDTIELLLQHGASTQDIGRKEIKFFDLYFACLRGRLYTAKFLFKHGVTFEDGDENLLYEICVHNPPHACAIIDLLLEHGFVDNKQELPVYHACKNGHVAITRFLLEKGANTACLLKKKEYSDARTVLHHASASGNETMVALLLALIAHHNRSQGDGAVVSDAGIDVNAEDYFGATALHSACASGHCGIVQRLLDAGAALEENDRNAHTPLYFAFNQGHADLARFLIQRGASFHYLLDEKEFGGLLYDASKHGHAAMVKLLLELDAAHQWQGEDVEFLHILLEGYSIIDAPNFWGDRPLIAACENRHKDVVQHLLQAGALVNVAHEEDDKKTPLHHAVKNSDTEIIKLLQQHGDQIIHKPEPVFALCRACQTGDGEVIKALLATGFDVNAQCYQYGTALHFIAACSKDDVALVELLLAYDADVHNTSGDDGATPLHNAVAAGNIEIAAMLLEHGANLEAQDAHHSTPLHRACNRGFTRMVYFLLKKGASVRVRDKEGKTALHDACRMTVNLNFEKPRIMKHVVSLLLSQGADPGARTHKGQTPHDFLPYDDGFSEIDTLLQTAAVNGNTHSSLLARRY